MPAPRNKSLFLQISISKVFRGVFILRKNVQKNGTAVFQKCTGREETEQKKRWKLPKSSRYLLGVFLVAGLAAGLFFLGRKSNSEEGQNRKFEKFTERVFCEELESNTVSLHYTLREPEAYGIEHSTVTFGNFTVDGKETQVSVENLQEMLKTFLYEKLDVQNRLTYDILEYYLELMADDAEYILYDEPLGLVSGVQTQLPVLLSEYPLTCREDVEIYLELMRTTPEYFESLIDFEKEKSKSGLFMSDAVADQVMEQCTAFMEMGENNYLISTFVERIKQVKELNESEKSEYIQENALALNSYVLPAYGKLKAEVQELKGTGKNEQGLCYIPNGTAYYEQIVREETGSERTVEEMEDLTRRQIVADLEAMEEVLGIGQNTQPKRNADESAGQGNAEQGDAEQGDAEQENAGQGDAGTDAERGNTVKRNAVVEQAQETASAQVEAVTAPNPVSILKQLEEGIKKCFPEPPKTNVDVKYVPKAMEAHLSPAFYMIPAIDDYQDNVIYVNQAHMGNTLTLYTTLAHEGYPGHLYQTVYYAGTNPAPIRNILNFGGYVEGWATYAEMCSYSLAPFPKAQAVLLQKNSSILLGIYTLADIGIHYHGWSRADLAAFFSNYGIKDTAVTDRMYDLILGAPGNYLKYYIGYVEFLELKKIWIKEMGADSPQKAFHEAVLKVGPAPFELVEKYMWEMGEETS